jgi:hypothetical protein
VRGDDGWPVIEFADRHGALFTSGPRMGTNAPTHSVEQTFWESTMAEIVLFEHEDYRGQHRHIYRDEPRLDADNDNFWHDRVTSFVVVSGRWQFFRDRNFGEPASAVFGPGTYRWVEAVNIPNDSIDSVRLISS